MSKLISTKNGVYIDKVPPLAWNTNRECTYSGCATLLLGALGCDTTYEQVMGLTASCFRTSLFYGWDPASNILDIINYHLGTSITENMLRYYGWESYHPENDETRDTKVMQSLNAGIPVLVLGGRGAPEWSILLGYENTADGVRFFGRSYFDKDAPAGECYTPNGYTWADHYPAEGTTLFRRCGDSVSYENALRTSLETCLAMFRPHEKFGYGAYTCMINSFRENRFLTEWGPEGKIYTILITLADARRAAAVYLRDSAARFSGKNAEVLLKAAELYTQIHELLVPVVQPEELDPRRVANDREFRENTAQKLESCLALEREAHRWIHAFLEQE